MASTSSGSSGMTGEKTKVDMGCMVLRAMATLLVVDFVIMWPSVSSISTVIPPSKVCGTKPM